MTVRKRGGSWHFDFQIRGPRYREAIPEARTKFQAEQAETKVRDQVFQGTFAMRLGDAGCNATTIARLLGHSNIQMSMRYTHASDDTLRSAVEYAQNGRVTNMSQSKTATHASGRK